jgi:outer membrane immunogenic protein
MSYSKLFVAAAACVLASTSTPSAAADLGGSSRQARGAPSLKDDNAQATPAIWQGLYVGLSIGASSAIYDIDKVGTDRDLKSNDIGVGAFAGYNFANGPWIWGVEADITDHGFDKKKKAAVAGVGTLTGDSGVLGSARLRGGYAWNDVLFYGTAGVAFTNLDVTSSLGGKSQFNTGFVAGVGVEWAFDKAWTARVEGMGYAFGSDDKLAGTKRDAGLGTGTVRLGIARKF